MASKKGLVLGVGILGISALALMNMDTSITTSLPQAGGVSQTSGNTTSDDFTDSDDYEINKSSSECSMAWDSNGNRVNNTWVYHDELSMKFDRYSCDLNGARAKVYTDKRVYIAGEPIKILSIKSYYETHGSNEWQPWKNNTKEHGEYMAFLLGLESTDGNKLLNFGKHSGSTSYDKKDGSELKELQWDGDLKSDWGFWKQENRGIVIKSVNTTDGDVGEYELKAGIEIGPYQRGSPCGASNCIDPSVNDDDCNNRTFTSQKLITILPRDCKNESSAESYKEAEGKKNCGCGQDPCITELAKQAKEAEGGNVLRAEHFIQSYHQNWV